MALRSVLHQKNTLVPKVGQLFTVHWQADRDITLLPIRDFFGAKTKVPEITVGNHLADWFDENGALLAKRIEIDIDTARNEVWLTFEWRNSFANSLGELVGSKIVLQEGSGLFDRRVDITTTLHLIDVFSINAEDPTGNPTGAFEATAQVVETVTGVFKLGLAANFIIVAAIVIWLLRSGTAERIAKAFIGKG